MDRLRFLMPLAFVAILALTVAVVMWLWNWLMPALFGLVTITYWQALGLLTLVRLLFGGHPFAGQHHQRGYRGHFGDWQGQRREHWGTAFRERWKNMSVEERKQFMNRHWHFQKGPFEAEVNVDYTGDAKE